MPVTILYLRMLWFSQLKQACIHHLPLPQQVGEPKRELKRNPLLVFSSLTLLASLKYLLIHTAERMCPCDVFRASGVHSHTYTEASTLVIVALSMDNTMCR